MVPPTNRLVSLLTVYVSILSNLFKIFVKLYYFFKKLNSGIWLVLDTELLLVGRDDGGHLHEVPLEQHCKYFTIGRNPGQTKTTKYVLKQNFVIIIIIIVPR